LPEGQNLFRSFSKADRFAVYPRCRLGFARLRVALNQADGFIYERSAIEQWLETHNTSPATGAALESKQLIPCHSLRSLIQDFHERGGRA